MLVDFAQLIRLLSSHPYLLLFPLIVVEGPIATLLAGSFAAQGRVDLNLAFAIIVAADVTGDCLWYSVGRWGGKPLLARFGRYLGMTPARLARVDALFERHGGKTLLVGKFSHGVGGAALVAAGLARLRPRVLALNSFLPTLPKSLALLAVGFYLGTTVRHLDSYLGWLGLGTLVLAVTCVIIHALKKRSPPHHLSQEASPCA